MNYERANQRMQKNHSPGPNINKTKYKYERDHQIIQNNHSPVPNINIRLNINMKEIIKTYIINIPT